MDTPNPKLYETQLSDEILYQGRIVTLHLQQVELPDGSHSKREIIEHPGAVAMVPVLPDGNIMLVRQFRKAANRVLLEVPAGTLNRGENPDLAASRELREEIGYRPQQLKRLGGIFVAPGYSSEYIHLYLAQALEYAPLEADSDEFIEKVTLSLDEVLHKIDLGEIEDAKTVSSIFLAARILRA